MSKYNFDDEFDETPKKGVSPEEVERMMKRVGVARRNLVRQGKNGTTFSPAVTQDPLLDIGLEVLLDCQKKEQN